MKPGCHEKYDYEYVRIGTVNFFMAVKFKQDLEFKDRCHCFFCPCSFYYCT